MDGWSGPLKILTCYHISSSTCSWLIVAETIYRHVILLYKHRNIKLCRMNYAVQLLDLIDIMKLLLDGWGHEGREPPGGQPRPHTGVHSVEVFQILLIVIRKLGIYFFHPPIRYHIFTGCPCTEIDNRVVLVHDRVEDPDQVEERLVEVHAVRLKPFPDEDDHWATLLVYPRLIKTSRLLYLSQVLLLRSPNKVRKF